jgi:mRNA interferase RelE/StbE
VARYRIALTSSAEKELADLPNEFIARILPRLEMLSSTPRPAGCKKLKGGDNEWRLRVGTYRIVYVVDDSARTIDVTRIAHRRDIYR